MKSFVQLNLLLVVLFAVVSGCSGPPTLHPIKGKVTLGGKAYARLIVYFRPINNTVDEYRLGVGETDAEGNLALRSSAGDGLAAGKYKVTFTCLVAEESALGLSDEKNDDDPAVIVPVELVPEEYTDQGNSPVEFEIKKGENFFEFDIPAK